VKTPSAHAQLRRDSIEQARRDAADDLAAHSRLAAGIALERSAVSAFTDFMAMRGAMLAGGLHRVRLTGGRSIDG
jgi:hypothetical protein